MEDKNIEMCARKLNKDISEIVALGKVAGIGEKAARSDQQSIPAVIPDNYMSQSSFEETTRILSAQYSRSDDRRKWWNEIFEMLPGPTLVIKDGTVVAQNKMSRIWGAAAGKTLCESCVCSDNCPGDNCPLKVATDSLQEASLCLSIKGEFYKIFASPMRYDGHDYMIVSGTEINEFGGSERRSGEDRRQENQ